MANFLKKISGRQKEKRRLATDPQLRRLQLEQEAKAVAYATVRSAQAVIQPVLTPMCNALSGIYIRIILYWFFKLDPNSIEQTFFEQYKRKCECIDEERVTIDGIIKHEIRGSSLACRPTLKWRGYKMDKLNVQNYGRQLPSYDVANKEQLVQHNIQLWGAAYANAMFGRAEVLALATLNDCLHWSKTKCQFFVMMFRALQRSTKTEVYRWIDYLKGKGIQYMPNDLRVFRKNEVTWVLALRLD